MTVQRCRVCNAVCNFFQEVNGIVQEENIIHTSFIHPEKSNMKIYKCPECTHMQIEDILSPDFYSDCYDTNKGSSQYIGTLDLTDEKIKKLRYYAANNDKFLDIGCGTGSVLGIAKSLFYKCIGIEPAKNACKIAQSRGFTVINDYFSEDTNLENNFSAFAAFQVLEHLNDIYSVMNCAYKKLRGGGGVGLINVPNGQEIIKRSMFHQLTFEHLNYFTPYSLALMAHKAGFDIIEINNNSKTIELDMYIVKSKDVPEINFVIEDQQLKLQQITNKYNNITIWGAGGKSSKYATLLIESIKIKYVVDSSMDKEGKYIAGINKIITAPSKEIVNDSNLIVIFASSYNDEIIARLYNEFNYKGAIVYFEDENVVEIRNDKL